MSVYEFQLVASGVLDDHSIDALFEAGCGDATFGNDDGVVTAMFAREASTLTEAVMSAIAGVEAVLGRGSVMRVEPDELVWASEIAHRLGRTRQSVGLLIDGKRGPGEFPRPAAAATRDPLWRWSEVADWFERYEGQAVADPERSAIIGAINGALEARRNLRARPDRGLIRAVKALLAS